DRTFVVRRRAREDAQLRIELLVLQPVRRGVLPWRLHGGASGGERRQRRAWTRAAALLHHGIPRALLRPLRRDDRLAVEMHVEQKGLGVGDFARVLGENQRLPVVRQLRRGETAPAERRLEPVGILPYVGCVDGVVGQRQHREELGEVGLRGALDQRRG